MPLRENLFQALRQTGRQTGRQTDRQATDRQTGRQAGRQADRQTGRQTDRRTGRQTDTLWKRQNVEGAAGGLRGWYQEHKGSKTWTSPNQQMFTTLGVTDDATSQKLA